MAPVYDTTGLTYNPGPATYNSWNATKVGKVVSVASPTSQNGATIWVGQVQWTPAQYADAGTTPGWYDASGILHPTSTLPVKTAGTPGVAAVYNPPPVQAGPPIPGRSTYTSTFKTENRGLIHSVLLCPSDPSPGTDPNAPSVGILYPTSAGKDYWASTNYVANWNTISVPDRTLGFKAPPQDKSAITDGLSNTILLAEAYAYCDGIGRTAYVAWHENDPTANVPNGGLTITVAGANVSGTHNFGLTYALAHNQIQAGNRPPISVIAPNGYSNPYGTPELIFEFQVTPRTLPASPQCATGLECCNALTVQSGHASGMNVTMADGSVRTLRHDLPLATWRCLLLPSDGQAIVGDW